MPRETITRIGSPNTELDYGMGSRETGGESLRYSWRAADERNAEGEPRDGDWVPAQALVLRHDLMPRKALDQAVVQDYSQRLDSLPPITVQRDTLVVIDGFHRVEATWKVWGEVVCLIRVRQVDVPDAELADEAVRANVAHGLPLTPAERRTAAVAMLKRHPDWSDDRVGAWSGVSARTVERIRQDGRLNIPFTDRRLGVDGIERPVPVWKRQEAEQKGRSQRPPVDVQEQPAPATSDIVASRAHARVREGSSRGPVGRSAPSFDPGREQDADYTEVSVGEACERCYHGERAHAPGGCQVQVAARSESGLRVCNCSEFVGTGQLADDDAVATPLAQAEARVRAVVAVARFLTGPESPRELAFLCRQRSWAWSEVFERGQALIALGEAVLAEAEDTGAWGSDPDP